MAASTTNVARSPILNNIVKLYRKHYKKPVNYFVYMKVIREICKEAKIELLKGNVISFPFIGYLGIWKQKSRDSPMLDYKLSRKDKLVFIKKDPVTYGSKFLLFGKCKNFKFQLNGVTKIELKQMIKDRKVNNFISFLQFENCPVIAKNTSGTIVHAYSSFYDVPADLIGIKKDAFLDLILKKKQHKNLLWSFIEN